MLCLRAAIANGESIHPDTSKVQFPLATPLVVEDVQGPFYMLLILSAGCIVGYVAEGCSWLVSPNKMDLNRHVQDEDDDYDEDMAFTRKQIVVNGKRRRVVHRKQIRVRV